MLLLLLLLFFIVLQYSVFAAVAAVATANWQTGRMRNVAISVQNKVTNEKRQS